jgi:ankyrin repeat protein
MNIKNVYHTRDYANYAYQGNLDKMIEWENSLGTLSLLGDVEKNDNIFIQALHSACYAGQLTIVEHLTKKISDKKKIERDIGDYLGEAADAGNLKLVQYFIESYPIKDKTSFSKALVQCARYDKLDILKYLVSKGGDILAGNNEAVRKAIKYDNVEVVKFLVENGANAFAKGNEAIKDASKHGHVEILEYLLDHGCDIEVVKKYAREKTNVWLTQEFAEKLDNDLNVSQTSRQRIKI